ncbi:MAG TPA: alpha/beta fold hydrolase [Terriglobales bacterium]|nr:alpha/beta fold hydrolase [Terriglobales bacterium]
MSGAKVVAANTVPLHAIIDGKRGGPAVLLLTGLGQQAIDWPDNFVASLVEQGCHVVRPDNRDAGLSPLCGPAEIADLTAADFPLDAAVTPAPIYRLQDMAGDVLALMDRLDIAAAHVVGFSMGGMIAQLLAATAPRRVLSLTSLMSSGGQPGVESRPEAWHAMARSICAVADPRERLRQYIVDAQIYTGPAYPHEPDMLRWHAEAILERGYRPAGIWRQALAVRHAGDRRDLLRGISVPTLVVHGSEDNCIALHQAEEGHRLIAGSRFLLLEGAGHDLHPQLIPLILPALTEVMKLKTPDMAAAMSGVRVTS